MERRRRLLRILLNAATVASLVLCVATVGLWLGTSSQPLHCQLHDPWRITSFNGRICVDDELLATRVAGDNRQRRLAWFSEYMAFGSLGMRVDNYRRHPPPVENPVPQVHRYGAPYAVVTAVTAVLPLVWIIRFATRARNVPGHCRACGYDLRATPDRCPECGTVPTAAPPAR